MHDKILILDFGSQVTQLIARRVREAHVFCEIHPNDVSDAFIREFAPKGIILSGSHASTYEEHELRAPQAVWDLGVPVLGICYGMQMAVIEFARNVCGLEGAHTTEADPNTPHPVIDLMVAQQALAQKGGTMRLGAQPCQLVMGTKAQQLYGAFVINERHRHRYEFNNAYREKFEAAGMIFSGTSPDGKLVELVELKDHPFYMASQFHPEFLSKPNKPHPMFRGFIAACHNHIHHRPL